MPSQLSKLVDSQAKHPLTKNSSFANDTLLSSHIKTVRAENQADSIYTSVLGLNTTGMSSGMACALFLSMAKHPVFQKAHY